MGIQQRTPTVRRSPPHRFRRLPPRYRAIACAHCCPSSLGSGELASGSGAVRSLSRGSYRDPRTVRQRPQGPHSALASPLPMLRRRRGMASDRDPMLRPQKPEQTTPPPRCPGCAPGSTAPCELPPQRQGPRAHRLLEEGIHQHSTSLDPQYIHPTRSSFHRSTEETVARPLLRQTRPGWCASFAAQDANCKLSMSLTDSKNQFVSNRRAHRANVQPGGAGRSRASGMAIIGSS